MKDVKPKPPKVKRLKGKVKTIRRWPRCEDCGLLIVIGDGKKCYTCYSMREGESGR